MHHTAGATQVRVQQLSQYEVTQQLPCALRSTLTHYYCYNYMDAHTPTVTKRLAIGQFLHTLQK